MTKMFDEADHGAEDGDLEISPSSGFEDLRPEAVEGESGTPGLEGLGLEGMELDADMAALLASLSDEPMGGEAESPSLEGPASASSYSPGASSDRDASPAVRSVQFAPFEETPPVAAANNIDLILDVSLRISVELGRTTMSIRDVLELGPGSVVELDRLAGEPVDILVNDHLIARGEVVVVDESFGVRVTDIVTQAKRVTALRQ